jgi:hypothetical protein
MLTRQEQIHQLNLELHQVQEAPDLNYWDKEIFLRDIFRFLESIKGDDSEKTQELD